MGLYTTKAGSNTVYHQLFRAISVFCLILDNETFNTRDVDFPCHTTKIARCPFTVKIVSLLKLLFQHLLAVGNPGHVLFHTFYLWWTISGLSFLDFAQNFECCYIKKRSASHSNFERSVHLSRSSSRVVLSRDFSRLSQMESLFF